MTLHSLRFEEVIDEVDFAALLILGSVEFEDRRYADGVTSWPKEGIHDFLSGGVPSVVGTLVGVCIREENNTIVFQGKEFVDLQLMHASGS